MALEDLDCNRCGQRVIRGRTGNGRAAGLDVCVNAAALDPRQELAALVAGCRTYTLHTVARELHPRDARVIRARPAGTVPRQTVHATHQCTRGTR